MLHPITGLCLAARWMLTWCSTTFRTCFKSSSMLHHVHLYNISHILQSFVSPALFSFYTKNTFIFAYSNIDRLYNSCNHFIGHSSVQFTWSRCFTRGYLIEKATWQALLNIYIYFLIFLKTTTTVIVHYICVKEQQPALFNSLCKTSRLFSHSRWNNTLYEGYIAPDVVPVAYINLLRHKYRNRCLDYGLLQTV